MIHINLNSDKLLKDNIIIMTKKRYFSIHKLQILDLHLHLEKINKKKAI
jgi:hypothetical protein